MPTTISTLAQQLNSISSVKGIQEKMFTFQQQISTGVKHQTFKEYGVDSQLIQEYRGDLVESQVYLDNIDIAQINIKQMNTGIEETIAQAGNVLSVINIQIEKGSEFDLDTIKRTAATALQIIQANMNSRVGDRYLFAGTDVGNAPYNGANTATANFQTHITDWLNGTISTATLESNIDGMTDSQLGYSTTVQTAKRIFARADDSFEVDYTVFATDDGFKNVLTGLNALANYERPAAGDVPTDDEFFDVLNVFYRKIQDGVNDLRAASTTIASGSQTLETVKQNLMDDRQNYQKLMEKTEATDITDSVVRFQSLQTQLEASFRLSSILSEMSLARFL
ncbi:MAG: hypothetical protein EBQ96_07140 [Proteobacteria bacterium]|nr:hypothetical protein [Pseudomonadota bacterium]